MEELWYKLKRNLARSYKSIRFNWRQYASFFAAIFLMQSFFWLILLTQDAQAEQLRRNAEENYDYHVAVGGLNQDQAIQLQNGAFVVFLSDQLYEIAHVEEQPNAYGGKSYTVYCRITAEPLAQKINTFERKYLNPILENADSPALIRVDYSPLLTLGDDIAEQRTPYLVITAIFALVAVLVLMLLYNIRINHFKFLYGIYMSFGADYKKLLYTAAWELITVSLLTLGPALIFAALVRLILCLTLDGVFAISLWTIPIVFVLNLVVIFAAVALPMRVVSMNRPVDLLAAEDNSNLVSSPRRSFRLFGQRFPDRYALCSIWRFRTYYIRLLCSSVIFAAISISVLYVGTMYADDRDADLVPYTIEIANKKQTIAEDFALSVAGIEGVDRVDYTYNLGGLPSREDHLLIPTNRVKLNASRYYVRNEVQGSSSSATVMEGYRATNNAEYTLIDEATIASLEQQAAASGGTITIEGDLRAALTTPGTVVVSDSIYNAQRFTLQPGDKLQLALYQSYTRKIDDNLTREKDVLRQQLRWYNFDYVELTVGAVVHGLPSARNIMLGMSYSDCESILGLTPAITRIDVVTDPTLDGAALANIDTQMDALFAYYDQYVVTTDRVYEEADLERRMGIEPLLTIVAVMVLIFFPLVCFFSQFLFYFKRNKEFSILLAIGGINDEIHRLHRIDGVLVSAVNFVLTLGLSFLFNWLVYSAMNTWLPSFGIVETAVRYQYGISPLMLILCLAVSVACGYLSCEIPYHQFIARQKKLAAQADALDGAH
ncbi:MAG: ABC transporter permease [Clostridia bacterium]|nr:ABC transporter permease [Clostridia bacterium]